jgi:Leucine-rich repeat (LRR) protein
MGKIMPVKSEKVHILKELEQLIGESIPQVDEIAANTFGVKLKGKTIIGLSLISKHIMILPESFGQLISLKELEISNNKLTTLPESFGQLKALQTLTIDENQLATLPESLGDLRSLQSLSLRDNQLTTLPRSFGQLQNLTRLSLEGNPCEEE